MKNLIFAVFILISTHLAAQSDYSRVAKGDEAAIRNILATQTAAWNMGNIDKFMIGYWENDSLMFIGKSGVTYGWTNTLNNYKKGYPDTAAMGKLTFNLIQVKNYPTNIIMSRENGS